MLTGAPRPDDFRAFLTESSPDFSALETALQAALDGISPDDPKVREPLLILASLAAFKLYAIDRAYPYALEAHDLNPDRQETCVLLAALGAVAGSFEVASYFLKLINASIPSPEGWVDDLVRPHLPDPVFLFGNIDEAPLERQGQLFLSQGNITEAEQAFRGHLAFFPHAKSALLGIVTCLLTQGETWAAVSMLRAARTTLPEDPEITDVLASLLWQTGDSRSAQALYALSLSQAEEPGRLARFLNHALTDGQVPVPTLQQQSARLVSLVRNSSKSVLPRGLTALQPGERATLVYVLDPLHTYDQQQALAAVMLQHDRQRVRVVGTGFGPLSADHNSVYKPAVDHWIDLSGLGERTLLRVISAESPHAIILDTGLNHPHLLTLLCNRIAPVQAMRATLPGKPDLPHLDLILTEGEDSTDSLYLPLFTRREPQPSQREDGDCLVALPGSFQDLGPETIAMLATALHRNPMATLILRNQGYDRDPWRSELLARFGNFGLAHRIDILDVPSDTALFQSCDLAVLPYGSGTPQQVVDALTAGLPCLTLRHPHTHLNRPAAFLTALGLSECVTDSPAALTEQLTDWIRSGEHRAAFAEKAHQALQTNAVLQPRTQAAALEAAVFERL